MKERMNADENLKMTEAKTDRLCYMTFETAIGACGIGWSRIGVTAIQLPEARVEKLEDFFARDHSHAHPSEAPDWVTDCVKRIHGLLETGQGDFSAVPLDWSSIPRFHRKVYEAAMKIEPGSVISYGELAAECGSPGAARAVGQAMAKNPFPIVVPCHRIISKSGKPGGFSAFGGVSLKKKLLSLEGYEWEHSPKVVADRRRLI